MQNKEEMEHLTPSLEPMHEILYFHLVEQFVIHN